MEKELNHFLDLPINRDFVRPELCKQLSLLGLHKATPYSWKISNREMKLHTNAFDVDNYYAAAWKHIESINGVETTPAYSISDCLCCLSSAGHRFLIEFRQHEYLVFPDDSSLFGFIQPVKGPRLADVVATYLKNLLAASFINVESVNRSLAPQKI